jgi:dinuclear metal center YbgI/SA1388 family protein
VLAAQWDHVGLQVGNRMAEVTDVVAALDVDAEAVETAKRHGAQLLVTHHPLVFEPLASVLTDDPRGRLLAEVLAAGISVFACHTNLDAAPSGLAQRLGEKLGLSALQPVRDGSWPRLYKLAVFVPVSHAEQVRESLCSVGVGTIGKYTDTTFSSPGIGTFRPGPGARPFEGKLGELARVDEVRLESILPSYKLAEALAAVRGTHPYEEIAYDVYELAQPRHAVSAARVGRLPAPLDADALAALVSERLGVECVRLVDGGSRQLERIMVVPGSGGNFVELAVQTEADALVTGDLKYHEACRARDLGLTVIDAGHHGTERGAVELLAETIQEASAARGWGLQVVAAVNQSPFRTWPTVG